MAEMPRAKVSTTFEHRITLGSYERERLNALIEAEAKKDKAESAQAWVKTGTGAIVPVLVVGALGVGVYAAYTIAAALADSPLIHPIEWIRQAGPSEGLGAVLNPFKEQNSEGDWVFRSTEGSYTVPKNAPPAPAAVAVPSSIGYSVPYAPQGWFESDAHYDARLASLGYTRQSYKEARAASAAKAPLWFGNPDWEWGDPIFN